MTGVILDTIIAGLLFVTVVYCVRLSKKITLLHQGKEELNQFINEFNHAIVRAEDNIKQLRQLGGDTNEKLQEHVKNARFLANDLSFLMEKGTKISQSLEHNISMSRSASAVSFPQKRNINTPPTPLQNRNNTNAPQQTAAQPTLKNTVPDIDPAQAAQQAKAAHIENLLSEANNIKPQKTANPSQSMTDEKRKALDDALSQIAARQKPATPATTKPPSALEVIATNAPSATPQRTTEQKDSQAFNSSRLQQTLQAVQNMEKK